MTNAVTGTGTPANPWVLHTPPGGSADENKPAKDGSLEAWARWKDKPVGGWYGLVRATGAASAMYVPPLLEHLGLVELEHNPRNNRLRAR